MPPAYEIIGSAGSQYVMIIGSAGDSVGGLSKKKSGKFLGGVHQDIADAKVFFSEEGSGGSAKVHVDTVHHVEGSGGSAKACEEAIVQFLKKCQKNSASPTFYYTGHGDSDGDWAFPVGYISFDKLDSLHQANHSGYVPRVYADCCHSGKWVWKGRAVGWHVIAASDCNKEAEDRVFARAVFGFDAGAREDMSSDSISAIATVGGARRADAKEAPREVKWFNGDLTGMGL